MNLDLRWITDLVTYFNPSYTGLPTELLYDVWKSGRQRPERFFR